jgi:DNA-binding FadR family transcriptional regulator
MKVEPMEPDVQGATLAENGNVDRAYIRLANQIGELLAKTGLKPGDRLPSERALADQFEVSRTSVREAIIAMELHGIVEVRGGSGAYLVQPPMRVYGTTAFMPEAGPGPFELLRARCLIESEIASAAAETRKDADLDRIFEALADMRLYIDDKVANEAADMRFHLCIAESTGNSVLLQVVTAMREQAKSPAWAKMDQHFHTTALRESSQQDHQLIFDAILARDPAGARSAMRAHLERVIKEFSQAWR